MSKDALGKEQETVQPLTFPADMLPVDRMDPGKCQLAGLFRQFLHFGREERSFLMYIPQKAHYNCPCIIAACPDGTAPWEFLGQSGLKGLADEEELFVCLPEPKGAVWELNGRDADFIGCVYQKILNRDYYVLMQDCIYAMGFAEGATVIQQAAMKMTSEWSGMASFGSFYPQVMRCRDASLAAPQKEAGGELVMSAEKCQLPVWMFFKKTDFWTEQVCEYWMRQNQSQKEALRGRWDTRIYLPERIKEGSRVNDDAISQTRMTEGYDQSWLTAGLLKEVWEFLGSARRHRGFGHKILRWYRQPEACGAVKRTMEVDGIRREWYEYIPQRLARAGEKMPLVAVLHGRGGDGESFFDITDMSVQAAERGFAAVFPTADFYQMRDGGLKNVRLWNGSFDGERIDSLHFIRKMVEDVCARWNIDMRRIYVCGQSSGGYMALCCAMAASDLFAAAVSWSGYCCFDDAMPIFKYPYEACFQAGRVPVCMMFGEKDLLFNISSLQPFPKEGGAALNYIRFLIHRLELEPDPWVYACHPVTYYVWHTPAGIPLLKIGIVADMPHANYPEESRIAYDEWFAWFSKSERGECCYMGEVLR